MSLMSLATHMYNMVIYNWRASVSYSLLFLSAFMLLISL